MRDQINVCFRDFRNNPLTFTKVVYTFPDADAELRLRCFQKMEEKYGKNPPKQISDRLEQELSCLVGAENCSHAPYFLLVKTLVEHCVSLGGRHSLRGCGGNSFVAYLLGITEVNPLPPHKYCPACGYVEFVDPAEWESGFDLFGGEQDEEPCPHCGAGLIGDGHNLDSTFLFGEDGSLYPIFGINVSEQLFHQMFDYLAGLGEVYENIPKTDVYAGLSSYIIEICSSRWLSVLKELEARTGVPARSVPIDRSLISCLAESSEYSPYISKGSFLVLQNFRPGSFSELVQVCGLSHGTGTWKGNAEDILGSVCDAKDVIAHRDDILQTLLRYGVERRTAVKLSHAARKGRAKTALTPELTALLLEKGVPEWYVSSMKKIDYLFPRAHATENCIQALRLTWYQAHFPRGFADTVLSEDYGSII